jgi:hypothetical protein
VVHTHFSHDHWVTALSRHRGIRVRSFHAGRSLRAIRPPAARTPVPTPELGSVSRSRGWCFRRWSQPAFRPPADRAGLQASLDLTPPVIGMVSTFQPSRRHELALEAFGRVRARLPRATLVAARRREARARAAVAGGGAGPSGALPRVPGWRLPAALDAGDGRAVGSRVGERRGRAVRRCRAGRSVRAWWVCTRGALSAWADALLEAPTPEALARIALGEERPGGRDARGALGGGGAARALRARGSEGMSGWVERLFYPERPEGTFRELALSPLAVVESLFAAGRAGADHGPAARVAPRRAGAWATGHLGGKRAGGRGRGRRRWCGSWPSVSSPAESRWPSSAAATGGRSRPTCAWRGRRGRSRSRCGDEPLMLARSLPSVTVWVGERPGPAGRARGPVRIGSGVARRRVPELAAPARRGRGGGRRGGGAGQRTPAPRGAAARATVGAGSSDAALGPGGGGAGRGAVAGGHSAGQRPPRTTRRGGSGRRGASAGRAPRPEGGGIRRNRPSHLVPEDAGGPGRRGGGVHRLSRTTTGSAETSCASWSGRPRRPAPGCSRRRRTRCGAPRERRLHVLRLGVEVLEGGEHLERVTG